MMMSVTERIWRKQYAETCAAIEARDAVITEDDGFRWIDQSRCGSALLEVQQGLARAGYAMGWMA